MPKTVKITKTTAQEVHLSGISANQNAVVEFTAKTVTDWLAATKATKMMVYLGKHAADKPFESGNYAVFLVAANAGELLIERDILYSCPIPPCDGSSLSELTTNRLYPEEPAP
jgi:hypothetical protein